MRPRYPASAVRLCPLEAWAGCLITHNTLEYIPADQNAVSSGKLIDGLANDGMFADNIYYFMFYMDQKVFSLISLFAVDGYHRYLGGGDGAQWITDGEPWRLMFNNDALYARDNVFCKDLVYLYYPFNRFYVNYDSDFQVPGGCSNPPINFEYDIEPAPMTPS